ncbi:MAG TPA: sigma-70 family RNA polymerase sigma factor [Myxococcales bacterium]|nr:sigma-70 family RNA polymerase sigma factor [Myxococcales bacterium]
MGASADITQPMEPAPAAAVLFPGLYEAELPYVLRSLRRLGVPAADAEDLTHEVFVVAFQSLDQIDASRPLRPWLFGIALKLAANFRRKAQRSREVGDEALEAPDDRADPEGAAAARQDRELVLRALGDVELDRRAVFVMYELNGHSMADIAEALGIPVNTAYSRLRLARAEFAESVRRLRPPELPGGVA